MSGIVRLMTEHLELLEALTKNLSSFSTDVDSIEKAISELVGEMPLPFDKAFSLATKTRSLALKIEQDERIAKDRLKLVRKRTVLVVDEAASKASPVVLESGQRVERAILPVLINGRQKPGPKPAMKPAIKQEKPKEGEFVNGRRLLKGTRDEGVIVAMRAVGEGAKEIAEHLEIPWSGEIMRRVGAVCNKHSGHIYTLKNLPVGDKRVKYLRKWFEGWGGNAEMPLLSTDRVLQGLKAATA